MKTGPERLERLVRDAYPALTQFARNPHFHGSCLVVDDGPMGATRELRRTALYETAFYEAEPTTEQLDAQALRFGAKLVGWLTAMCGQIEQFDGASAPGNRGWTLYSIGEVPHLAADDGIWLRPTGDGRFRVTFCGYVAVHRRSDHWRAP